MNDYTPGSPSVTEFDEERRHLLEAKGQITIKKMDLQTKLTAMRNRIRSKGLLPREEYAQILKTQDRYKNEVIQAEKDLVPIKNRLVEISNAEHLIYAQRFVAKAESGKQMQVFASPVIVQELVSLAAALPGIRGRPYPGLLDAPDGGRFCS